MEKHIFSYAYVYFLIFFLLDTIGRTISYVYIALPKEIFSISQVQVPSILKIGMSTSTIYFIQALLYRLLDDFLPTEYPSTLIVLLGLSLIILTFNTWRRNVTRTFSELINNKRITVSSIDVFFENYNKALRSRPIKYLLLGSLLMLGMIYISVITSIYMFDVNENTQIFIVRILCNAPYIVILLTEVYVIGFILWEIYASGKYLRKVLEEFDLQIDPMHPDNCGGLKLLGNFCFGLVTPALIGTVFFITSDVLIFYSIKLHPFLPEGIYATLLFTVGVTFLYVLPITLFAFFHPLQTIHEKMIIARDAEFQKHAETKRSLQEKMRKYLGNNQLKELKDDKEEMELLPSLYPPCPTWPFSIRGQILSNVLKLASTVLVSVLATLAALLPEILKIFIAKIFP